jgi:GST-like protein
MCSALYLPANQLLMTNLKSLLDVTGLKLVPINRYAMETKRQLDVLNRHLADREYLCASGYSIADIAIWPWYGRLAMGELYGAAKFLDTASYTHVIRWAEAIQAREAVQKGLATAL